MTSSAFIENIFPADSVAGGLATLALAVAIGIALGNLRFKGVRLGVAAVLFSAMLFAQLGLKIDPHVLDYFRDFALVLFVYTLGLQMGPGFFSSLRAEGLRLNILAVAAVILGAVMTGLIVHFTRLPRELASGLYTGGFATTPALAAGEEALRAVLAGKSADAIQAAVSRTDLAYSVAYPFGLTGPILLVILFRLLFRVKLSDELKLLAESDQVHRPQRALVDVLVTNPEIAGRSLRHQCFLQSRGVLLARLQRGDVQSVPNANTVIELGDIYRAVGPQSALDELIALMGKKSAVSLPELGVGGVGGVAQVQRADLVVTHRTVLGKSLRELDLINRFGVTVARVQRAGVDLAPGASFTFHFGDTVLVIGPAAALKAVEEELGNSNDALNQTQLIPIFLGIWLGVVVGSLPIPIPGLNTPVRIGLAGGPMLVAIALSRLGNIGSVVWYMPPAANQILRDFGMAVFLACVGFQSGDNFYHNLVYHGGLPLVAWGMVITMVPMLLVGLFARLVLKMNFVTLTGLISGAMTSSPTLLFANETTGSSAPALAYAAVYPLSMLVPVFCAQLLVTILMPHL
jgi:putative transport protein